MYFKDIIGQSDIKQRLIQSVKTNHIAHAQLFAGTEGVGKFQLAYAYARYIQCTNRGDTDSCGSCGSCIKYNNFTHPDLHFVFPIIKKNTNSICYDFITEWREFLKGNRYFSVRDWLNYLGAENKQAGIFAKEGSEILHKLFMKPYESEYKIMLIWLPERMHDTVSNKLLKILEEPYPNTIFLLVSNEPETLLATIQSRAQRINVRPLSEDVLTTALHQQFAVDTQTSRDIAHIANGNVLKAIEHLRLSEDKTYFFEKFTAMMRLAYGRKLKEMKEWSDEIAGLGRERQRNFLNYAQHMIRENFILNLRLQQLNYLTPQELQFSERFSPFVNERNTEPIMEELGLAEAQIAQNANAKILFFDLALRFIMLLKQG